MLGVHGGRFFILINAVEQSFTQGISWRLPAVKKMVHETLMPELTGILCTETPASAG